MSNAHSCKEQNTTGWHGTAFFLSSVRVTAWQAGRQAHAASLNEGNFCILSLSIRAKQSKSAKTLSVITILAAEAAIFMVIKAERTTFWTRTTATKEEAESAETPSVRPRPPAGLLSCS